MTTQPSAEYRRHHEIEAPRVDDRAFRQGWRVRTQLDRLLADGRITPGQWQAAIEYRDAWGTVHRLAGIPLAPIARVSIGGDHHHRALDRLAVVTRLREAETAIGDFAARLCYRCAVEDLTWAALGHQLDRDPQTVRDWTVAALAALAGAWANGGKS